MLKDNVAVVTGAGRGIGKAVAKELASNAAFVIVNYNGSKEKAEKTVAEIIAQGGAAAAMKCDVSSFDECQAMFNEIINKYGHIDILVNNSGITKDCLILKMKEEDFEKVIDVNLKGTFNCIKSVTKQMMKQRKGRIINLSSVVGISGNAGQANYAASKAGVIGLTKAAAKELAPRNITVNAVAPGFIETDMTSVLSDNVRKNIISHIPLKTFGTTKNVADAIVFLSSDKASYITGQVLSVDGGMAM